MDCVICKNGTTQDGLVTVTLERNGSIIAIKDVPAKVCNNCGEYYLDSEMTKEVLEKAEEAILKGVEIEVIRMTKVA
ncbi:MAG: type II toxin-antitoxin system MqsA family antitoxin [Bacteroidota bacterium]|nr:type II toxin-antitoxin system MqsA family antitoxin [Bacteroidota bacterium]